MPRPTTLAIVLRVELAITFVAMAKGEQRKRVIRTLRSKYRLVLINDRTFKEGFSIRLSQMNMWLLALGVLGLTALLVGSLIAFTPLKKFIPGYSDHDVRRASYRAASLADSLRRKLAVQEIYLDNLRKVLSGDLQADSAAIYTTQGSIPTPADLAPSKEDSAYRRRMERDDAYSLQETVAGAGMDRDLARLYFFTPLRGLVTSVFDRKLGHYGVDVVAKANEAVKATLDGTVLLASWTTDGGYVMHVQHAADVISVYKHNAILLKKVGDHVKAGEAIAIVGNSGELTEGPHLHFELWRLGEPLDPQAHMVFK
jgi:murein DD-endopeptidase MepM/ murein hydrolase activator NlpD